MRCVCACVCVCLSARIYVVYGHGSGLLWREGAICGKHVPHKPNTPMNCELDWSMRRRAHDGADAWLQALDESIIGHERGGIAHHAHAAWKSWATTIQRTTV